MGFGDELIASGQGVACIQAGKRAAFTDPARRKIIWSPQSQEIHAGNPHVAKPGEEKANDIEWIINCKGHRPYAKQGVGRWYFREFKPTPGLLFFTDQELGWAEIHCRPYAVIEPRVKPMGACVGANKQWPVPRYQELCDRLWNWGIPCMQFVPPGGKPLLPSTAAHVVATPSFRHAAAILKRAVIYVGPEGGLHHAAAAVGIPAVVLFGGFASPQATGYDTHTNIGVGEPCGQIAACPHCAEAMSKITVERVFDATVTRINRL